MKRLFLLALCLLCINAFAQIPGKTCEQTIQEVLQNDSDYLFAEFTGSDESATTLTVEKLIKQTLMGYLEAYQLPASEQRVVSLLEDYSHKCVTPRANNIRVFAYIKISDIPEASVSDGTHTQTTDSQESDSFQSWEEMLAWLSDYTVPEPPKSQETDTAVDFNPFRNNIPALDDNEDDLDVPTPSNIKNQANVSGPESQQSDVHTQNSEGSISQASNDIDSRYQEVARMTRKNEIFNYIKKNKNGKYKTDLKPSDKDYYLIMYTRNGTIRAILSPRDPVTGERINIQTGGIDSIYNYRGCAVDGFILTK